MKYNKKIILYEYTGGTGFAKVEARNTAVSAAERAAQQAATNAAEHAASDAAANAALQAAKDAEQRAVANAAKQATTVATKQTIEDAASSAVKKTATDTKTNTAIKGATGIAVVGAGTVAMDSGINVASDKVSTKISSKFDYASNKSTNNNTDIKPIENTNNNGSSLLTTNNLKKTAVAGAAVGAVILVAADTIDPEGTTKVLSSGGAFIGDGLKKGISESFNLMYDFIINILKPFFGDNSNIALYIILQVIIISLIYSLVQLQINILFNDWPKLFFRGDLFFSFLILCIFYYIARKRRSLTTQS
jgi:hypothetical protein